MSRNIDANGVCAKQGPTMVVDNTSPTEQCPEGLGFLDALLSRAKDKGIRARFDLRLRWRIQMEPNLKARTTINQPTAQLLGGHSLLVVMC